MSEFCWRKRNLYDPSLSHTSKHLKRIYHVKYDIGETAGFVYEDVFAVSG